MSAPTTPLMAHATAAWLVDNTGLTFEQIAVFCGLHILEVQAIADDTAATKLTGRDPIRSGELTQAEIDRVAADPKARLRLEKQPEQERRTKGPRYTPVSMRQDKPDGIAWIVRNHPEVTDNQIAKLIGTTKTTIAAIRDKSHWNMANITPEGPGHARPLPAARTRRAGHRRGEEGGSRYQRRRRQDRERARPADRAAPRRARRCRPPRRARPGPRGRDRAAAGGRPVPPLMRSLPQPARGLTLTRGPFTTAP